MKHLQIIEHLIYFLKFKIFIISIFNILDQFCTDRLKFGKKKKV